MPQTKTEVIAGFPGVGKSYFCAHNTYLNIIDSDSSLFSWISKGVRDPQFPDNYIEHIQKNIGEVDVIPVSSHKVVREALQEHKIAYTVVYPNLELKDEYIQRYRDRGNDENFIHMIEQNWDNFIKDIEAEAYPMKISLHAHEYLSKQST
jgi:hypothetical protein